MPKSKHLRLVGLAITAAALSGLAVNTTPAEVSAEVDLQGRYIRTVVVTQVSVRAITIWNTGWNRAGYIPLNRLGDLNGDLWPVIVESPVEGNRPWVVWSAYNGSNYDLAWSKFEPGGWRDIGWVQPPSSGDDLDPDMTLDDSGRPYLTWWADDGGTGRVYFSVYLDSRWMASYLVSDAGIDSRYPEVTLNADNTVTIDYETPAGPESRTLLFHDGVSINDDIDPINSVTVSSFGE